MAWSSRTTNWRSGRCRLEERGEGIFEGKPAVGWWKVVGSLSSPTPRPTFSQGAWTRRTRKSRRQAPRALLPDTEGGSPLMPQTDETTHRHHVPSQDLGTVLTLLRSASGLSQLELVEASGLRSISEYERGKLTPSTTSLKKILAGLSLPWGALDLAQGFLQGLEANARRPFGPTASLSALELALDPEALREETEQALALAEKAFFRLLRLLFVPLFQGSVRLTRQQLLDILDVEERSVRSRETTSEVGEEGSRRVKRRAGD